jgi:hypothetical protein
MPFQGLSSGANIEAWLYKKKNFSFTKVKLTVAGNQSVA